MKLKGSKKAHYESGPNMTPLVDVVMVILIFLMLAGSFGGAEHYLISNTSLSKGGVGAASSKTIDDEVGLDIRVDSKGPDAFTATAGRISTDDPVKLTEQLRAMRDQLLKTGSTDDKIQVKISPGKKTAYRHLVAVYEAAMRADLKKIAFATAH